MTYLLDMTAEGLVPPCGAQDHGVGVAKVCLGVGWAFAQAFSAGPEALGSGAIRVQAYL